ncbi:glycoside hydrolase family 113 [Marinicrinis sediminis]|uniref:1,4-beta-xylanase n=1 Tax=Marinicrinis sediminis TaxID=1652465 RepID=A0ABW5R8Z0_9BACL
MAGMTWGWTGIRGSWTSASAQHSMKTMKQNLHVSWTTLAFGALQAHAHATEIPYWQAPTVTDEEVIQAVQQAKSLGLKVCLKPVVNCADGTWRAHINFFDIDVPCEPKWSEWFASYTSFMLHYARLAEATGCDMLCIGCEMVQTDRREAEWRQLIRQIRSVYKGPLTYNCDKYQEDQVKWWDAVDVISSSGYYPIHDWEAQLDRIEAVVQKHEKPFLFMEAGCPSRTGSSLLPNDWELAGEVNLQEQKAYYEEMFRHCEQREWVGGFMLWDWPAELYAAEEAAADKDYNVYAKPAEEIVATYYQRKLEKQSQSSEVNS